MLTATPKQKRNSSTDEPKSTWTFLTNHSHVLLCLVQHPSMRMRDIAEEVGITERAVQRIIADLRDENYITLKREGRCNTYQVNTRKRLKHSIESHRKLKDLIQLIFN